MVDPHEDGRPYRIIEIPADDLAMIGEIGRLRVRAWATERPEISAIGEWIDPVDRVARHWVIVSGAAVVASARLSVHRSVEEVPDAGDCVGLFADSPPPPVASLNRLVVAPEARGNGLSGLLDLALLDAAEAMGCRSVVASTSTGHGRLERLVALGFEVVGDRRRAAVESIGIRPRPGKVLARLLPRGNG